MASFFDEIARNKAKSILLMAIFCAIFFIIMYVFVIFLGGGPFAIAIGAAVILLYAAFSYFEGDKVILKMSGAKKADPAQYPTLFDAVDGLAAASQVPKPDIYIINDPNPNAFATGRNKKHACIAVTSGLLSMMNREELQGVVSHEISHISDNDIQFMMLAIVFAGAIGLAAAAIRMSFFFGFGGNNRNSGGIFLLIALALSIIAPIMAYMVRLAISRKREYMADANGARITRNPQSLANALKKIEAYTSRPDAPQVKNANDVTASLYFSSPLKKQSLSNLFSTHPPTAERIKRLEQMY